MTEDFEELYVLAEGQEVRSYVNSFNEASVHVHEYGDDAFLYVQSQDFGGERQRTVLAHYSNGELRNPEQLNEEALGDILMGAGEVELNESVLERKPRFA